MPKPVQARAAHDTQEERQVRKLARSHHAPADCNVHAQMLVISWAGKTPNEIAAELGCHAQPGRIHLARCTAEGIVGLGMRAHHSQRAQWLPLQRQLRPHPHRAQFPKTARPATHP